MPKFEKSEDRRGFSLKVDGVNIRFDAIKDTETRLIVAFVINGNTNMVLDKLNA